MTDLIELEFVVADDVPQNELEWHEKDIPLNTVFVKIFGPNPITGEYTFELVHLSNTDRFLTIKESCVYYRKKGEVHYVGIDPKSNSDIKRRAKYLKKPDAVELWYRIIRRHHTCGYKYLVDDNGARLKNSDGDDRQYRYNFTSIDDIKTYIKDMLLKSIKADVARAYPTTTAGVYKFEV